MSDVKERERDMMVRKHVRSVKNVHDAVWFTANGVVVVVKEGGP